MSGQCKDCRYFNQLNDGYQQAPEKMGDCTGDFVIDTYVRSGESNPTGINVESDEGWCWFVGEDFGCIHFLHD